MNASNRECREIEYLQCTLLNLLYEHLLYDFVGGMVKRSRKGRNRIITNEIKIDKLHVNQLSGEIYMPFAFFSHLNRLLLKT